MAAISKYDWNKCNQEFKFLFHGYCTHKCLFNDNCSKTDKFCVAVTKHTAFNESYNNLQKKLNENQQFFDSQTISFKLWATDNGDILHKFIYKWENTAYSTTKEFKEMAIKYKYFKNF